MGMKYRTIMWGEREINYYGGDTCDQLIPKWRVDVEDDMGQQTINDNYPIVMDPSMFPPGTTIMVSVPCCPICDETMETCSCRFDWDQWAANKYS